eukprot:363333-Chlamydomonas_euryale.AAC.3
MACPTGDAARLVLGGWTVTPRCFPCPTPAYGGPLPFAAGVERSHASTALGLLLACGSDDISTSYKKPTARGSTFGQQNDLGRHGRHTKLSQQQLGSHEWLTTVD